jgi:Lysylphosphatidylglycerol synthase TM region
MKKFHHYSMALGIVLLGLLIWKIGPRELLSQLESISWGILPLILMEGLAHLFYTLGWCHCLSGPLRSLTFFQIFRIYMAGHSMNYLTPMAGLGGELTKGALLSLNDPGPEAATGVMIGRLAFALAQLLYVVAGSFLVLRKVHLSGPVLGAVFTGGTVVGGGILGFLIVQKRGKLGAVVRWMVSHKVGGKKLERAAHHINQVDVALELFYKEHGRDLPLAVAWHVVGMTCGILQSWYFLNLLTGTASVPMAAAISILGNWMDLLGFAIPVDVGILEGTRVVVFTLLGFPSSLGLTYGVAVRFEQIFWVGAGLLIYATLLVDKREGRGLKRIRKVGSSDDPVK